MFSAIAQHTPIWVYPLLVGLIALGWSQSKTRTIPVSRALIAPVVMTVLSLSAVFSGDPSLASTLSWLAGWFAPIIYLTVISNKESSSIDLRENKVVVRGSWWPMVLFLSLFATRFVTRAAVGFNPELSHSLAFVMGSSYIYGALSGAIVARALPIIRFCLARLQSGQTMASNS